MLSVHEQSVRERARQSPNAAQILVVEDTASIRELVEFALRLEGWHVSSAGNGMDALGIVTSRHVDLVILDWMLPDLDGIAVMQQIREVCAVPVILLTARDDLDSKVRALENGANGFILKPFRVEHLIEAVAELLGEAEPSSTG